MPGGIVLGIPSEGDPISDAMAFSSIQKVRAVMFGEGKGSQIGNSMRDFFTMLAVCHTVMVEEKDKEEKSP